ncbi:hypothetical protein [Brevibacillus formosus]|uniref:hypothetical protein n=1 Tax=Brevibacillus formosus TaxID=54913 RepID=UPI0038783A50
MKIMLCLLPEKRTTAKVITDAREYLFSFGDLPPRRALALIPVMIRDVKGKQGVKRKGGRRT